MHIHSLTRAALAACVAAALAAAPASAAPVQAELRVEANGHDLGRGFTYVNDTANFRTSRSDACGGTGQRKTLRGPTALGLLVHAVGHNRRLRPVQVSDQFDFGLFVCGVGRFESSDSGFWLYKVNHEEAQVGADQYRLRDGHEVLFYYSNMETGSNTGKELGLELPGRRVRAGRPFPVRAVEYDAEGRKSPAAGVRLLGGGTAVTDENGELTVTVEAGTRVLRGVREGDIPTRSERICVWERARRQCRGLPLNRIIGTRGDDRIKGGPGPDLIRGRGGKDRIDVRGGGIDRVRCGPGRDTVLADKRDRVGRGCERVIRR